MMVINKRTGIWKIKVGPCKVHLINEWYEVLDCMYLNPCLQDPGNPLLANPALLPQAPKERRKIKQSNPMLLIKGQHRQEQADRPKYEGSSKESKEVSPGTWVF